MSSAMKDFFQNILENIVGTIFVILTIVTLYEVFLRYILNSPTGWSEELARYLLVWGTFFGASVGVKRMIHIDTGFSLFRFLPGQFPKLAAILTHICILLFLVVMTYKSVQYCLIVNKTRSVSLGIGMGYIWSPVPFNGFVMLVLFSRYTLAEIWGFMRRE